MTFWTSRVRLVWRNCYLGSDSTLCVFVQDRLLLNCGLLSQWCFGGRRGGLWVRTNPVQRIHRFRR